MTIELVGSILFFSLTVFALIFSLTKSSHVDVESFPNRGRFFAGLILWTVSSILAVFMSFPGYSAWFIPVIYPIMQMAFSLTFLLGFFMVLTTINAFPLHMDAYRQEINGRSDRIALLENIRRIASQPYPITELFTLTLKELSSFLIAKKGAVFMVNPSKREMYLVAQIGLSKDEISRLERFPIGQDIVSRASAEQMPFISGDLAASDSSTRKLILAGRDITMSAAAMPLSSRDKSLGAMLVLSDKPYRFEKQERMVLGAAAEAVAAEVESNRMARENQKLTAQLEISQNRLDRILSDIKTFSGEKDFKKTLNFASKEITERYGINSCRVVQLVRGELLELSRFDSAPNLTQQSESYRIAVIDAIRRKKMVVLNQEAKSSTDASIFINRSTLLCPFTIWAHGDYALLVEAPGNGLPLNDAFLRDIDVWVNILTVSLNMAGLKEADSLSQSAVKSLLNILKIKHNSPIALIYQRFLEEAIRVLPPSSAVVIYVPDQKHGYRLLDGCNIPIESLIDSTFLPGEGPIGRSAASGSVLEFNSIAEVEEAWKDLEPSNQDFFGKLFGERGLPTYQLNIPIEILDDVVGIIGVFDHSPVAGPARRERGLLLLAAQLLSIKLSMARMDDQIFENISDERWHNAGGILNRLNNDLANILGRTQLLERQSDINGRTRFTAGEIVKASESAAELVQKLQEGLTPPVEDNKESNQTLIPMLDQILDKRRVTGNIYMFADNKAVTLQTDIDRNTEFSPASGVLQSVVEMALQRFVTLIGENQEVFITSNIRDGYFYFSIVRGEKRDFETFDASAKDFGDPDVLPDDFIEKSIIPLLHEKRGEVSFDRFGRKPTYLSFRFPDSASTSALAPLHSRNKSGELKILAIDDQQMILDLLSGICKSLGVELTAVNNPEEGLTVFARERFDIIMVDLVMEGLSGWDVARAIRKTSSDIPIIMMTGWGVALSAEETRRAGIDFTLTKPFKIEQLTEIITKARRKLVIS